MVNRSELSAMTVDSRCLAASTDSLSYGTASTFQVVKIERITLTNSTWAILMPGQYRGPADQGRKVPRGGSISVSNGLWLSSPLSQRVGLKISASLPHIAWEVWMTAAPTWNNVPGAKCTFLMLCGLVATRAIWGSGVKRRSVSNYINNIVSFSFNEDNIH